jgi:hypothetical protein
MLTSGVQRIEASEIARLAELYRQQPQGVCTLIASSLIFFLDVNREAKHSDLVERQLARVQTSWPHE